MGAADPDGAAVRAALSDAALDLDPEAVLGAGGAGLSGGQSARLSLARALYRLRTSEATVLALDEPSAALDAETEGLIVRTMRRVADDGVAVLVVSHRAAVIEAADAVLAIAPVVAEVAS
jgi:ATP-binding cassette, subfamily C, bacterial CydD